MLYSPGSYKYNFQRASYFTQLLTVFSITDIFFFTVKTIFFGLQGYYILHFLISTIFFIICFFNTVYFNYYNPYIFYNLRVLARIKKKYFSKSLLNFRSNYNLSLLCLICLFFSFYIALLILLTWKCTIVKQVLFAVSFILFLSTYSKLYFNKVQYKIKLKLAEEEKKRLPRIVNVFNPIEGEWVDVEIPPKPVVLVFNKEQHPFHILPTSAWPFFTAFFTFDMLFFTVHYLHYGLTPNTKHHLLFSIFFLIFTLFNWFTNIVQEAQSGDHTKKVRWNLLHGMMLFILSEVMLFFAIFWAFFHSSLAPTVAIYCVWPPLGIEPIYAFGLPLFNTVLLLSSGVSLTYSHRAVLDSKYNEGSLGLLITLTYGMFFTLVQLFEYVYAPFSINDGIYGSVFYFSTGFHGLHVIIGSIMLLVCLIRNELNQFSSTQHVGFTCSIWYWHFVDVVWIFLFITIYWWGS